MPSLTPALGLGFPHLPDRSSLNFLRRTPSWGYLAPLPREPTRSLPTTPPGRGRSAPVASPARGSAEARAAPGASRPRRRPAVPAQLPPPLPHRCRRRRRRRACRELPRRRGSPVAAGGAIPSVFRSARRLEGARSSRLAASRCRLPAARRQHALALGVSCSQRGARDAPSLQDGRGFLPTAGFEGRELPSRSDRPRGRGFPCRNDKVGGDSPRASPWAGRAALPGNQQSWCARFLGILGGTDPGRLRLRIAMQAGFGAPSRWKNES